jgi:hypothetical protein
MLIAKYIQIDAVIQLLVEKWKYFDRL